MYTLSIILNFHHEGILADKTIHNLQNILNTKHSWKEIEILAVLDNPDELTKNIVYKYQDIFDRVDEVDFRDAANSRNYGINIANKNFILFADGDDYVSHNILLQLYLTFNKYYSNIVKSSLELSELSVREHIAIVPKYLIEFPNLFKMEYCNSNDLIVQNNKFIHCYHSKIVIYRDVLIKYNVRENKSPYGYEDWDLNNCLLASGIKFKISNYDFYYRKMDRQSNFKNHIDSKSIVRNSLIYSYSMINTDFKEDIDKTDNYTQEPNMKSKIRGVLSRSRVLKKLYHLFKKSSINQSLFKNDKLFLESYGEKTLKREDIESASIEYFASNLSIQAKIYNQLLEFLLHKEVVYFFPWIGLGGADKVSAEYTKALSIKNSCVITSISSGNRIKSIKVPHLDLLSELDGWSKLSAVDQLHILIKAILNSDIKLMHVVNSDIALQTIKYYGKIYKEYNIKTIVTLFCPDYDWVNDEYHGYPIMYPELFENADLIISDNNYWYDFFKKLNNNRDFKYKKLASPTQKMQITYHPKVKDTKKILWASRICNQKLFNIFEEIVNKLPQYQFIIYGAVSKGDKNQKILNRLIKKENLEFRGEYQHISEIDLNEFDLYLFTSLFEGIPTIILDMIMGGIPIVSADVGGVSEVFGVDYPLLVRNQLDANAYVKKIEEYYNNKEKIVLNIQNSRNFVVQNHSGKNFQNEYNICIEDVLNDNR